jgi:putative membrane protein
MRSKSTITWISALAASGLLLAFGPGAAQAQQRASSPTAQTNTSARRGQLSAQDYNFLVTAARIDQGEVQLGQLAQKQGTSQAVRNFGERMINDHSKANIGLKDIASQKDATLPTQLSKKQDSVLQRLEGLSGVKFDKTYAQDMVKGHTKAIKEFETASKGLSDPDLRAWAQTALPLLQEHLRMAKSMEQAVKAES